MGIPTVLLYQIRPDIEAWVFVVTVDEYRLLTESGKFAAIDILQTIPYPNGKPGFYFLRLSYKENIYEILQEEKLARRRLHETSLEALGTTLHIGHSALDMGEMAHLFDDDLGTVARTSEANPMVLEIRFEKSMTASGLRLITRDAKVAMDVELFPPGGGRTDPEARHGSRQHRSPRGPRRFQRSSRL